MSKTNEIGRSGGTGATMTDPKPGRGPGNSPLEEIEAHLKGVEMRLPLLDRGELVTVRLDLKEMLAIIDILMTRIRPS